MGRPPEPVLRVWFAPPGKVALAPAVPTSVLLVWTTVRVWFKPPAPVAAAVQGVCAKPVYGWLVVGQVTVTVEVACEIVKLPEPALPLRFASPAQAALAPPLPPSVLLVWTTVRVWFKPPAPVAA